MRYIMAIAIMLSAFALSAPAAFATGTGKYCLKGPGATMNCKYQTMAACDKAKKGTETCVANLASTTGSGQKSSAPMKKY
jgi:hypothetical protein